MRMSCVAGSITLLRRRYFSSRVAISQSVLAQIKHCATSLNFFLGAEDSHGRVPKKRRYCPDQMRPRLSKRVWAKSNFESQGVDAGADAAASASISFLRWRESQAAFFFPQKHSHRRPGADQREVRHADHSPVDGCRRCKNAPWPVAPEGVGVVDAGIFIQWGLDYFSRYGRSVRYRNWPDPADTFPAHWRRESLHAHGPFPRRSHRCVVRKSVW